MKASLALTLEAPEGVELEGYGREIVFIFDPDNTALVDALVAELKVGVDYLRTRT